jgi:hypothetical protein
LTKQLKRKKIKAFKSNWVKSTVIAKFRVWLAIAVGVKTLCKTNWSQRENVMTALPPKNFV